MHAERCPRLGRDPTLLRSVLGFHVVDFSFFLPDDAGGGLGMGGLDSVDLDGLLRSLEGRAGLEDPD